MEPFDDMRKESGSYRAVSQSVGIRGHLCLLLMHMGPGHFRGGSLSGVKWHFSPDIPKVVVEKTMENGDLAEYKQHVHHFTDKSFRKVHFVHSSFHSLRLLPHQKHSKHSQPYILDSLVSAIP